MGIGKVATAAGGRVASVAVSLISETVGMHSCAAVLLLVVGAVVPECAGIALALVLIEARV